MLSLKQSILSTSQGEMIVIVDDAALYLLEFINRKGLDEEIKRLCIRTKHEIVPGRTVITDQIERELQGYFAGSLTTFATPITFVGTPFQQRVWHSLRTIPFGHMISYQKLAQRLGNPQACRAVARANATNQLALIVPCHRVIAADGSMSGYAAGVERKKWLLEHEQRFV